LDDNQAVSNFNFNVYNFPAIETYSKIKYSNKSMHIIMKKINFCLGFLQIHTVMIFEFCMQKLVSFQFSMPN